MSSRSSNISPSIMKLQRNNVHLFGGSRSLKLNHRLMTLIVRIISMRCIFVIGAVVLLCNPFFHFLVDPNTNLLQNYYSQAADDVENEKLWVGESEDSTDPHWNWNHTKNDFSATDPHIDKNTRALLDIKLLKALDRNDSQRSRNCGAITAVTQMSVNEIKLQRLKDLASRWSYDGGYISVAIYVPGENAANSAYKRLQLYFEENSSLFNRTVVQMVVDNRPNDDLHGDEEDRSPYEYPINILRNIAIQSAPTDHIMYIDVDFIPSVGAHFELVKQINSIDDWQNNKMALILPAFNRYLSDSEDGSSSAESLNLPRQKSDLLQHVTGFGGNESNIAPFNLQGFPPGHGPTKFPKWYEATKRYKVQYKYKYEPYFVIKKNDDLPLFWEYFHGRCFNKWSWVGELSIAGYRFYVDPSCFLIHIDHKYSQKDEKYRDHKSRMKEVLNIFKEEHLLQTYGKSL